LKNSLVISLLLLSLTVNAQYILKEDPEHNAYNPKFGPNCKFYVNPFIRLGFITGAADNTVYSKTGNSFNYAIGVKFKEKLNNVFSLGAEISYNLDDYGINPNGNHADSVFQIKSQNHNFENFTLSGLQANLYVRINLDPNRPMHSLGKYLDLGGGAERVIIDEYNAYDKTQNTTFKNLPVAEQWEYNYFARVGMGSFAVCFTYRASDLFFAKYNLPEPPPYSIGLEIDPYTLLKGLGVFP